MGTSTAVETWVDNTKLVVGRGMQGATGNLYCGLHEYRDMTFVLDTLTGLDLFIDVGANVGTYTLLASGVCGARTVAIEPAADAFESLLDNIALNGLDELVDARCVGVGDAAGLARFTVFGDAANRIVRLGDREAELAGDDEVTIRVNTLDDILDGHQPTVIKIDVEGWEIPVLNGARSALASPSLLACIVEVNGAGARYGTTDHDVFEVMRGHGFDPAIYDPDSRQLEPVSETQAVARKSNVIFVRDIGEIERRTHAAPDRQVLGRPLRHSG